MAPAGVVVTQTPPLELWIGKDDFMVRRMETRQERYLFDSLRFVTK